MFAYSNRLQIQNLQGHSKAHYLMTTQQPYDYIPIPYLIRIYFSFFLLKTL